MTWQDDIINELYKYYEQDKSTTKDNWVTNPQVHKFIRKTFIKKIYFDPFDHAETLRHFEFLRHIMYTICKYIKNNEYLNFITRILVTILEENGISIEHVIMEDTKIYKLVVLPKLLNYFKDPNDGIMKLSNGSVKKFIQAIVDGEIDRTICEQMEPIINTRTSSYTSSYTSKNLGEGYYKKTKTRNTRNTNTKYKKRWTKNYKKRWTKNYKKEQKKEQKKRKKNKKV